MMGPAATWIGKPSRYKTNTNVNSASVVDGGRC